MNIVLLGLLGAAVAIVMSKKDEGVNTPTTEIEPGSEAVATNTQGGTAEADAISGVDADGNPTTIVNAEGGPRLVPGSTSAEVSDMGSHPMRNDGGGLADVSTNVRADPETTATIQNSLIKTRAIRLPPRAYASELQRDLRKLGVGF